MSLKEKFGRPYETEFACKWNKPGNAPWEFQECESLERRNENSITSDIVDFSCSGVDCGYYEKEKE